ARCNSANGPLGYRCDVPQDGPGQSSENTTFFYAVQTKASKNHGPCRMALVFSGSDLYNLAQPIFPLNTF
ncbi:hypothetical protein ACULV4_004202, partial [Cronobacter dublinensis]